jgi:predicted transposase/invertase (TIGR01784 family)
MTDPNIQHAYEDLAKLAADKDAKRQYELREKAERDFQSTVRSAHDEGLQEGLQQGARQERMRLASKLLAEGLDEDLVKRTAEVTQIELEIIKKD